MVAWHAPKMFRDSFLRLKTVDTEGSTHAVLYVPPVEMPSGDIFTNRRDTERLEAFLNQWDVNEKTKQIKWKPSRGVCRAAFCCDLSVLNYFLGEDRKIDLINALLIWKKTHLGCLEIRNNWGVVWISKLKNNRDLFNHVLTFLTPKEITTICLGWEGGINIPRELHGLCLTTREVPYNCLVFSPFSVHNWDPKTKPFLNHHEYYFGDFEPHSLNNIYFVNKQVVKEMWKDCDAIYFRNSYPPTIRRSFPRLFKGYMASILNPFVNKHLYLTDLLKHLSGTITDGWKESFRSLVWKEGKIKEDTKLCEACEPHQVVYNDFFWKKLHDDLKLLYHFRSFEMFKKHVKNTFVCYLSPCRLLNMKTQQQDSLVLILTLFTWPFYSEIHSDREKSFFGIRAMQRIMRLPLPDLEGGVGWNSKPALEKEIPGKPLKMFFNFFRNHRIDVVGLEAEMRKSFSKAVVRVSQSGAPIEVYDQGYRSVNRFYSVRGVRAQQGEEALLASRFVEGEPGVGGSLSVGPAFDNVLNQIENAVAPNYLLREQEVKNEIRARIPTRIPPAWYDVSDAVIDLTHTPPPKTKRVKKTKKTPQQEDISDLLPRDLFECGGSEEFEVLAQED